MVPTGLSGCYLTARDTDLSVSRSLTRLVSQSFPVPSSQHVSQVRLGGRYWSLRAYFAGLVGVFIVVACATAAYVHVQTGSDARANARDEASFAATAAASELTDHLISLKASVRGLAALPNIAETFAKPAGCSLQYAGPAGSAERGHIDIIAADGTPVCSSASAPAAGRTKLYQRDGWLAAARRRPLVAAPVLDPASGRHVAVFAEPIAGGVVAAFFDLTAIGPHLASRYGGGRDIVFVVTSGRAGKVLARSLDPQRWIGTSLAGTSFASDETERTDLAGKRRIFAAAAVPGFGWRVAAGEDLAAALEDQKHLEFRQLLIILGGLLFFLAAAAAVYRRLASPIAQLGSELRAGADDGQPLPVGIPTSCPKELRALATDVNALVSAVNQELLARRSTESALRHSEETYRELFDRHPAAMFVYEPDTGQVLQANETAVATYGYTRHEFLSMTIADLWPADEREQLEPAISTIGHQANPLGRWPHQRKDGTLIDVEVSSTDIVLDGEALRLVLTEDVTEKTRLQHQLQQIYKMEAVGQLTAGIAHDFNNLLTVISGFGAIALESLPAEDDETRASITEVQRACDRASGLTRQLLAFSRRQVLQQRSLDLNRVVTECESLLRRIIDEDIAITTELADDLGHVYADESQISQVLMNLAVNARDAMPDGGRLTIRTRNELLDSTAAAQLWDAPPGHYVLLEVSDTGIGMDENTKDHLFEPFFTTKPVGRGTGLGLATVFGIVKQSGGYIKAESTPGSGTTFTTYLPRHDASALTDQPVADRQPRGGNETILIVEDEPAVRRLIELGLGRRGFTVLSAGDPQEALKLSWEHNLDAVVTDVVMPGMNGRALVEELRSRRPQLRALYTSGYTTDAVLQRGVSEDEMAFLQKPFTPEELTTRLRELLDS
jgi:PAS domain S-box-containing protein